MPLLSSRRTRASLHLVTVLTVLGAATACTTAATPPGRAPSGEDRSARVSVTATTAGGATVTVPDGRPAVVYFFAPSCYSCIAGTRAVARARAHAPTAADYVAVNIDPGQNEQGVRDFLAAADGSELARTSDAEGRLVGAFGVRALGTLIVLDARGRSVYTGVDPPVAAITEAVDDAAAT